MACSVEPSHLAAYVQVGRTSKVLVASSYMSGSSLKSGGALVMNFCDALRDSFGGLPGSNLTVISPPTVDSILSTGVWLLPCDFSGDCVPERRFLNGFKSGLGVDVADREGIDLMLLSIESLSADVALSNLRCATSDSSSSSLSVSPKDMAAADVLRNECVVNGVVDRGLWLKVSDLRGNEEEDTRTHAPNPRQRPTQRLSSTDSTSFPFLMATGWSLKRLGLA
jgi:hypothetical protein